MADCQSPSCTEHGHRIDHHSAGTPLGASSSSQQPHADNAHHHHHAAASLPPHGEARGRLVNLVAGQLDGPLLAQLTSKLSFDTVNFLCTAGQPLLPPHPGTTCRAPTPCDRGGFRGAARRSVQFDFSFALYFCSRVFRRLNLFPKCLPKQQSRKPPQLSIATVFWACLFKWRPGSS